MKKKIVILGSTGSIGKSLLNIIDKDKSSFDIILLLFAIACIATIGNFLWTKALSQEALTNLMPFEFSKLLFATIFGILFFNEKVDLITIFSGTGLLCLNH